MEGQQIAAGNAAENAVVNNIKLNLVIYLPL
jgi:hypothetical protein